MAATTLIVLKTIRLAHGQIVGKRARHQRRADMHVPGERSRPAKAAELGGCEAIGGEIGTYAAFLTGDADCQPAFCVHVAKVLDGETRLAIVSSRARREYALAEPACLVDEFRLQRGKAKSIRGKDRRLRISAIERIVHGKASGTGAKVAWFLFEIAIPAQFLY